MLQSGEMDLSRLEKIVLDSEPVMAESAKQELAEMILGYYA